MSQAPTPPDGKAPTPPEANPPTSPDPSTPQGVDWINERGNPATLSDLRAHTIRFLQHLDSTDPPDEILRLLVVAKLFLAASSFGLAERVEAVQSHIPAEDAARASLRDLLQRIDTRLAAEAPPEGRTQLLLSFWDCRPLADDAWGNIRGFNDNAGDGHTVEMRLWIRPAGSTVMSNSLPMYRPAGAPLPRFYSDGGRRRCCVPKPSDVDLVRKHFPEIDDPRNPDWLSISARLVGKGHKRADLDRLSPSELLAMLDAMPTNPAPPAGVRESEGGKPEVKGGKPGVKGKNVNGRMAEMLQSDPEKLAWSARLWAEKLVCSEGTVKETTTWKQTVKAARALQKAHRMQSPNRGR